MILTDYRYEFDIAGLIVLVLLFRFYLRLLKLNDTRAKFFFSYSVAVSFYLAIELFQTYTLNNIGRFSNAVLYSASYAFFAVNFLIGICFLAYAMISFSQHGFKLNKKRLMLYSFVGIIACLAMIINPFYPWLFEFKNGEYVRGNLHLLSYIIPLIYLILSVVEIAISHNLRSKNKVITIASCAVLILAAIGAQYFFPYELLAGFALALSVLFVFLSFHDPNEQFDSLTGMLSKDSFTIDAKERLGRGRKPYVYVVAMNNFTKLNSTYGNYMGDEVLRKIASIISKVSFTVYNYRYGADRFVGFSTSETVARETLNAVREEIKKGIVVDGQLVEISARYALVPAEYITDFGYLIRQIDYAVVESKKGVLNSVYRLDESINAVLMASIETEEAISKAIEGDSILMYYQPINELKNDKYTKAEALLRIKDKNDRFISAEFAIKYAEEKGLMVKLGNNIVDSVFKFITENSIEKYGVEKISINLSMVQCVQPNLCQRIIQLAKKYNVNPSLICFEITETASVTNPDALIENMNALIDYGFEFSLDDYGSGYSTIDYIVSLPFKTVKIDKRIINMLESNMDTKKILTNTIEMLHSVGKSIIAEGVEDASVMSYIKSLDVEYIQGYYYAKPLSPEQYLDFLEDHNGMEE